MHTGFTGTTRTFFARPYNRAPPPTLNTSIKSKSLFWHGLWILCGKPETGQVARIMRFTRNNYHYKIREIKNESRSRAKQSLANTYWSEIKKINKSKIEPISIVNGEYAHKDIAN